VALSVLSPEVVGALSVPPPEVVDAAVSPACVDSSPTVAPEDVDVPEVPPVSVVLVGWPGPHATVTTDDRIKIRRVMTLLRRRS
jgi:hypothetical protein